MSVRWMAVQYVGNTLRLPIVNHCDMDKAIGASRLERDVERIVVNQFGDNVTFVPEPPTCTMEPDGWYGEEHGIYKCSSCGELWQFECDGPREHGWTCCPRCRATIDYGEGE